MMCMFVLIVVCCFLSPSRSQETKVFPDAVLDQNEAVLQEMNSGIAKVVVMCLLLLIVVCCVLMTCHSEETKVYPDIFLDQNEVVLQKMNSLQIIRKFGYPVEAHEVITADGYVLQLHRIPFGKNFKVSELENARKDKPPVLLQHGIFGSSANYLVIGPEQGLPFLLADMGFDVWLGNFRGNTYSRANINITSEDKKFWDFTWHESGVYDLPAEIDYIREFTHYDKIIYMGFSMGTTSFFVLTSELPEYNDKILVAHLMAPAAYTTHIKSPLIQFLAFNHIGDVIKDVDEALFQGEFLPNSPLLKEVKRVVCQPLKVETAVCESAIFLVTGFDYTKTNTTVFRRLISEFPAGYSVKGALLYAQNEVSGRFGQFDHGPIKNQIKYGSLEPPEYRVENIRTPLYFYEGKNDFLSTMEDLDKLKKRLSSLRSEYVVDWPKFDHLDFLVSSNIKKQVFDPLLKDLTTFLENNTVTENKI